MSETIRVARVIARLNVGGPARHVTALARRLSPEFHTRLFVGAVRGGEREMASVVGDGDIDLVRVPGLGAAVRPGDDARALFRLLAEMSRFRPHIVHTHTAKAGALGRVAASALGVGVRVHTFHGHVFDGYFSPTATRIVRTVERTLARTCDAIVTLSPLQRQDIVTRYRIAPASKVHVVRLGFDFARFDAAEGSRGAFRRAEHIPLHAPLVACVGRLTAIKDVGQVLRAVARLADDVRLVVVGGGEEEPALRGLARALGLGERVHFLGFREDVPAILTDVDVVALSSKNEGTPVALIEAMAAGCHPVATDVGGVADVLDGGRHGTLVASRDVGGFAEALRRALDARGSPAAGAAREARRAFARATFGLERMVREHADLYGNLLRRPP